MKKFLVNHATFLILIMMIFIMTFLDPAFFTPRNLSNLSRQVTTIGIISIGMTGVILIAGIDLSVGSVAGLAAVTVTLLMKFGLDVWSSIFLTLLLSGAAVGLWNGFWIAYYKIPAFIITLGMMTIAHGLALTLTNGGSVPVTNYFFPKIGGEYLPIIPSTVLIFLSALLYLFMTLSEIREKKKYKIEIHKITITGNLIIVAIITSFAFFIFVGYRGIPVPVLIFIILTASGSFILSNTKFGRRIYAMGGNSEAARLSGINVFRTTLYIYIISSVFAALSGIILASRLNGASPNLGDMFELDAISAVIIGGTSFTGGIGTIVGSVIGAFIIGVLNNGMSILGINMFYQLVIKGFIIIMAVWFDVYNKKKK